MMISRRDAVKIGILGAAFSASSHLSFAKGSSPKTLKVLVLGGTSFLGPAIVQTLLNQGHEVTLFNRQITNPQLFPQLEKLRGNRFPELNTGLKALEGRRWEVAIDTCGYFPRVVKASTDLLREAVKHYVYISSIAVYADFKSTDITESAPVRTKWDPSDESEKGETYGARKARCEAVVSETFTGHYTVPRCHVIAGPRNTSNATRYWPVRISRGGEVLVPGDGADPVQYGDVFDIADFVLASAERSIVGIYNIVSETKTITFLEYVEACKRISGSSAKFTWIPADGLKELGVERGPELPLWTSRTWLPGFNRIMNTRALKVGFRPAPLSRTIAEELSWFASSFPADYEFGSKPNGEGENFGMTGTRERELLAAWHSRRS